MSNEHAFRHEGGESLPICHPQEAFKAKRGGAIAPNGLACATFRRFVNDMLSARSALISGRVVSQ